MLVEMANVRLIVGLIVTVVSFAVLFGFAIPNVQHAQEVQRQAQLEYDLAQAELDEAMNNLTQSVEEINAYDAGF